MDPEKQKIESETRTHDNSYSKISSSNPKKSQTQLLIFIFYASLAIALLILFLPRQNVNGCPVPAFLFASHPSMFHALVFSVMLSFAAASSGLLIGINSQRQHATIQKCYFGSNCDSSVRTELTLSLFTDLERLALLINNSLKAREGKLLCQK
ncbi:hypothetical protein WN944_016052 [Citrus x changshan-huyou]|uniref:Uncharacterized protein n=1 Tax=Citrus x changshan-huyou TaxID=2935761 RepID=A0AAP0QK22_9ROSI